MSSPLSDAAAGPQPPTAPLTAKQVRELRRLCRKTANRAEYDDRSVQVRQIASILAMATPSLPSFAPPRSGAALQAWLDRVRADGADWRDERMLLPDAAAELRDWDRLLKAWIEGGEGPAAPKPDARKADARKADARKAELPRGPATPARPCEEDDRLAAVGTPITPVVGATPRPRLVPVRPQLSPLGPAVHFSDDGSSDGGDSEVSAEEHEREPKLAAAAHSGSAQAGAGAKAGEDEAAAARPPRRPLTTLSINRVGNVIDVSLPNKAGRPVGRGGRPGKGDAAAAVAKPKAADENARPPERNTSGRNLLGLSKATAIQLEPATDRAAPRDWSALRAGLQ